MGRRPDVIVVGGGVAGCSVAYFLARRGIRAVVVEAGRVAGEASGVAAGMLTPLAEISDRGPFLDFALKALRLHARLAKDEGLEALYTWPPVLRLAFTTEEKRELESQLRWQERVACVC